MSTSLETRVAAFKCFELPGQPLVHHAGTSQLISDLMAEVVRLRRQDPFVWGVDWGKCGDKSCVSIMKRYVDGTLEVVAMEVEGSK